MRRATRVSSLRAYRRRTTTRTRASSRTMVARRTPSGAGRGRGAPRGRVRRHQGGGLLRQTSERVRGGFRGGRRRVYRRLRGLRPPPRRSTRAPRGSRGDGRRRGPQRRRALPGQLQARASRPLLRVGHRGRHRSSSSSTRHFNISGEQVYKHSMGADRYLGVEHASASIDCPARARVLRHHRPRPLRQQTHRLRGHRRRVRAHGSRAQSPPRQLPRAVVRPLSPPRARLRARRRTRARRTETIRSRETRRGTRHRGLHDGSQRTAVSRRARAGVSHRSGLSRRVRASRSDGVREA